jgi:hypothetical protein
MEEQKISTKNESFEKYKNKLNIETSSNPDIDKGSYLKSFYENAINTNTSNSNINIYNNA